MTRLRIDMERCKGCGLCVEYCVKKILVLSERLNRKGYRPVFLQSKEECIGCGNCEAICPDLVITSLTRKEQETRNPSGLKHNQSLEKEALRYVKQKI